MEKVAPKEAYEPDKFEQSFSQWKALSDLQSFCSDWVLTHYWEALDRDELSPEQAKLHDIAKVLNDYMQGDDPFKELRADKSPAPFDPFTLRVAALLLTDNKKKVSEFFSLPDDGKTLNSSIATRASQFCNDEQLEGLSIAQKSNLTLQVIEQNRQLKEGFIQSFRIFFGFLLEEKRKQDITYKKYSFKAWVKMASSRKRREM